MKRFLSLFLAIVMCCSMAPSAFAENDAATAAANKLHALGLFNGTGTDAYGNPVFDLDRAPTRHEAVTMLVRLLGKDAEAKAGTWDIPFTDVADWAKPYVGYAYANGLTSGTSATTFSGNTSVSASQYLTFILRALGYESGIDFQWNAAWELSDLIGLTAGEYNATTTEFLRGDVAILSRAALYVNTVDDNRMLLVRILASKDAKAGNSKYSFILNNWPDLIKMAPPRLTQAEIQTMISLNLSLDEVADIIATPADLVQYLYLKGYTGSNGDLQFPYGGYTWSVNRSAKMIFEDNKGNCGGGSNLVNYILRGDFDTQGYVGETGNQGGHIYNYFEQDGMYYFFDLVQIVRYGEYSKGYQIFSTANPQEFSDFYIERNHQHEPSNSPTYLLLQFMFEYEGNHPPKGVSHERTPLGFPYANILPKQFQDVTIILYVAPEVNGPVFIDAPGQHLWPKDAQ